MNKEESKHAALYGKRKPIESAPIKSKYIIEFDENHFTFHVNGNSPHKKSYHIYQDKIIGSYLEGPEIRDSIRFELIHSDTLTIEIKEMGKPINVKHFKVSK